MEKAFNVGTPTKENIEYAFKNLIFYINASIYLDVYKEYKEDIKKIVKKIDKILALYVHQEKLIHIDEEILQDVKYDLIDLDAETKSLNSYYVEWSLLWFDAIISLRITEINSGGIFSGE